MGKVAVMSAISLGGFTVINYEVREVRAERRSVRRVRANGLSAPQTTRTDADQNNQLVKKAIDELLELRRLGADWDGEGAVAPIPELVDGAIDFVAQRIYTPPSRVVPINDGRIAVEWYQDGCFVSLRVESPYRGRQMFVKPDGSTQFSEIDWNPHKDARD
jgi:hypothetical protein